MMTFSIKVKDDTLVDVKFQTFGCVAAIAVSSMVSEMAKGKNLEEAKKINNKKVAETLGASASQQDALLQPWRGGLDPGHQELSGQADRGSIMSQVQPLIQDFAAPDTAEAGNPGPSLDAEVNAHRGFSEILAMEPGDREPMRSNFLES